MKSNIPLDQVFPVCIFNAEKKSPKYIQEGLTNGFLCRWPFSLSLSLFLSLDLSLITPFFLATWEIKAKGSDSQIPQLIPLLQRFFNLEMSD